MAVYYNEDGKLQDFPEGTRVVICEACGKRYRQDYEEQVPGFRDKFDDICPYCQACNGYSMSEEFFNYKLPDES